jgi:hypothetical protein
MEMCCCAPVKPLFASVFRTGHSWRFGKYYEEGTAERKYTTFHLPVLAISARIFTRKTAHSVQ